jgi:hypothetical protein
MYLLGTLLTIATGIVLFELWRIRRSMREFDARLERAVEQRTREHEAVMLAVQILSGVSVEPRGPQIEKAKRKERPDLRLLKGGLGGVALGFTAGLTRRARVHPVAVAVTAVTAMTAAAAAALMLESSSGHTPASQGPQARPASAVTLLVHGAHTLTSPSPVPTASTPTSIPSPPALADAGSGTAVLATRTSPGAATSPGLLPVLPSLPLPSLTLPVSLPSSSWPAGSPSPTPTACLLTVGVSGLLGVCVTQ